MGKRCQVLGLPSLACPWHWEGLWQGPQTVHHFSSCGGAMAVLWPLQEGQGGGRGGHAFL